MAEGIFSEEIRLQHFTLSAFPARRSCSFSPLPTKNVGFGATDLTKESEALPSVS